MSKKQNKYNTRKDILSKEILPTFVMIRLVKKGHVISLAKSNQGRGYWIKKTPKSFELFNNRLMLCKIFKDHQVVVDNLDEIKNALLN